MGIEQIQSAKNKALLPAFSVQLESNGVKSISNELFLSICD